MKESELPLCDICGYDIVAALNDTKTGIVFGVETKENSFCGYCVVENFLPTGHVWPRVEGT